MSADERAQRIKLLAMDVDGVLTDGAIIYAAASECEFEIKAFDVRDGLGIKLALRAGIHIAWLTGRKSDVVVRRARELGVATVTQGVRDKGAALRQIADQQGLALEEVAFIGDDLNDLPAMRFAGLAFAPADAVETARRAAHYVTEASGGRGAVREVIGMLLRAQGKLGQAEVALLADLASGEDGTHD